MKKHEGIEVCLDNPLGTIIGIANAYWDDPHDYYQVEIEKITLEGIDITNIVPDSTYNELVDLAFDELRSL